ncbi:hypothetical protein DUNSADRAFT_8258 [Dunaliella salina]|uniref:Alpha-type protein kinase domain-containing protein n=1 Tax=Dunaliella salina TaxID=3046 RepID=A0ABQ7HA62_DUNSA|nr:hypothetical protein DUNSADRAFT_8258 [Dunaliella salina]|eukprot:KAF5843742.1 hypothetical protein DUNSADRAFT_8258 [Dunaliella salina]
MFESLKKVRDSFLGGSGASIKADDVEQVLKAAEKFGLGLQAAASYMKKGEGMPQISPENLRNLKHQLSPWEQKLANGSILGQLMHGLSPLSAVEGIGPQLVAGGVVIAAVVTSASQAAKISQNCGIFLETLKDLDAQLASVSDSLSKKGLVPHPAILNAVWRLMDLFCHGGWVVQEFQKKNHFWRFFTNDNAKFREVENKIHEAKKPKVFVGSLPYQTSEADVRDLFIQYGEIKSCVGKSKGSAIVTFRTWTQAERAIDGEDGTKHLGGSKPMHVRFANSEPCFGIIAKMLCIHEVPPALSKDTLYATFARFGTITELQMEIGGLPMGSAYVAFDRWSACEAAVAAFHEKTPLEGTDVPMKIGFAKPSLQAPKCKLLPGPATQPSSSGVQSSSGPPYVPHYAQAPQHKPLPGRVNMPSSSAPQSSPSSPYVPPHGQAPDNPDSLDVDDLKAFSIKDLKAMFEERRLLFPTGIEKEEVVSILAAYMKTASSNTAAPPPTPQPKVPPPPEVKPHAPSYVPPPFRAPPPPPPQQYHTPPPPPPPPPQQYHTPPPAVAEHSTQDKAQQCTVKVEYEHGQVVFPWTLINQRSSIETLKEHLWEETGLYPSEQRLTSAYGEDLQMYRHGKPQRLQDYNLASPDGPGCKLRLDPLYSTSEGHSNLAREAARKDSLGLPPGKCLDLGLNGAFKGLEVGVLNLYTGNGGAADSRLPQALEKKGFRVTVWSPSSLPGVWALGKFLERESVCQLWVISDSKRHLSDDMMSVIKDHFNKGLGVFICGGNGAFIADANALGSALLGATMDGNNHGGQTLMQEHMTTTMGYIENHALNTGIKKFFEGLKIASVAPFRGMQPVVWSSAGGAVCAAYNENGKRAVLDGGLSRLFDAWKSDGTERFVKNAAVWLANYDTKGGQITDRHYMLNTTFPGSNQWGQIQALRGLSIQYQLIKNMDELKDLLFKGNPLPEEKRLKVFLKVAPEPFSLAGLQLPYYARRAIEQGGLFEQALVVRRSRLTNKAFNDLPACQVLTETQAVAAFMSRQFNKASGSKVRDVRIDAPRVFSPDPLDGPWRSADERECFVYDSAIEGIPIEDSNEEDASDYAAVLQSFGHWTWSKSAGLLLVTEQHGSQGIYDQKKQYFLVDPAIHCKMEERFGKANRGNAGIDQFFRSHVCNGLCQLLHISGHRPAMS